MHVDRILEPNLHAFPSNISRGLLEFRIVKTRLASDPEPVP